MQLDFLTWIQLTSHHLQSQTSKKNIRAVTDTELPVVQLKGLENELSSKPTEAMGGESKG